MVGFPREVRTQVLVEAARHCAVCHRYKALGVEVHHIVPSANGGADTEDNAIALCFDCHTAAGHYNPRHPRGSKVSPNELRLAKAKWKETVASGVIADAREATRHLVTCRHVVTSDNTALNDLLQLARDQLPFGHYDLVNLEPTLNHIRECFAQPSLFTGYMGRRSYTGFLVDDSGRPTFRTAAEFHLVHPEFGGAEERPLTDDDHDFLSQQSIWLKAVQEGTDPAQVGKVLAVGGLGCGDDSWHEEAIFRVPHAVFMQIRNDGDRPVQLKAISAHSTGQIGQVNYRPLIVADDDAPKGRIQIPPTTIPPTHSLLVPEGIFYGPLEDAWFDSDSEEQYGGDIETSAELKIQSFIFEPDTKREFAISGPWLHVRSIEVDLPSGPQPVEVHAFNPKNPFVSIHTAWMAGSCPHVFLKTVDGHWHYGGEILTKASSSKLMGSISCSIPSDVTHLRIAELEYETTKLKRVSVDGACVVMDTSLRHGDWVDVPVRAGQRVTIQGYYCSARSMVPESAYEVQKRRQLAIGLGRFSANRAVGRYGVMWERA